jgi:serine/threonine protein kinase
MITDLQSTDDLALPLPRTEPVGFLAEKVPALAGYMIEKRIGSGGSGEVWKAVAPGGKAKAVKIIFGCLDERRAAQELKSLNRVKSLQHPFLLALESVTVVDGRVVIVTDLAEASLQDRFLECQAAGLCGIPHGELMAYLAETAEALDYLESDHGLQHLDIKPENLLLVGNHIRVADFGLLKDMTDANASLINGLTPKYAAPEVFDGRPSRSSDQYSLAIVFQEMATGTSPFSGRTAAQLASQHLHSSPDLSPLSPLERFAVGKALAKDPAMRFRNCREFVERLVPRSRTTLLTGAAPVATAIRPPVDARLVDTAIPHDGRTVEVRAPELVRLPAIQLDAASVQHRPTVFLGIGHTGGRILSRIKQLLTERFGLEQDLPAFQMLYIDTDVDAVNEIMAPDGGGKLSEAETLLLPIHSTWNYRNSHVSQIESISRRWLFNIPRSQKTEGMRALGRLALLDHAERVKSRLRKAILSAADRDSIAATTAATGLSFSRCDPRVFVVASLGGGTGSGMLIDAGYAVRQMLIETGFSDDQVVGILAFVSRQNRPGPYLAPANALACLRELRYFSSAGDYPGEIACGLAGFREELPTFAQTYFVDLGEQLAGEAYSEAANRVASYIVLSSVTSASPFFDAVRVAGEGRAIGDLDIRSFSLESLGTDSLDVSDKLIDQLCRTVILNWRGLGTIPQSAQVRTDQSSASVADKQANETYLNRIASDHAAEIGLDLRSLFKAATHLVENQGQVSTAKLINDVVAESLGPLAGSREAADPPLAPILKRIHQFIGVQSTEETELNLENGSLRNSFLESAQRHGQQLGTPLEEWILALLDRSECRVAGAQQIAGWLKSRLDALAAEGIAQLKQARQAREQLFGELSGSSKSGSTSRPKATSVADDLRRYTYLLLQEATFESVLKCLAVVEAFVCRSSDRLRDLWKDLNRLADEFGTAGPTGREGSEHEPRAALLSEMADDAKDEIERSFLKNECTLGTLLSRRSHLRPQLVVALREAAKKVVRKASRQSVVARLGEALTQTNDSDIDRILGKRLASLEQTACRSGGALRLLLSLTERALAPRIADRVAHITGEAPTLVCDPQGEMIAVYEIEQVPMTTIANRLIRSKPDCESLASRLHTRTDVNFGP